MTPPLALLFMQLRLAFRLLVTLMCAALAVAWVGNPYRPAAAGPWALAALFSYTRRPALAKLCTAIGVSALIHVFFILNRASTAQQVPPL